MDDRCRVKHMQSVVLSLPYFAYLQANLTRLYFQFPMHLTLFTAQNRLFYSLGRSCCLTLLCFSH